LRPRTIAVFGGREAARVVEQCDKLGFDGEIWPVHPKRESVAGRRAFAALEALPAAPDAAFVGVNRHLTIDIVRGLAEIGAGGAVCYASGFRESDGEVEGAGALQAALIAAAGAMPIVGPNCYGLVNALDGALLWPDQHGLKRAERGVAIIAQSSNIAINLSMQRRGLPIAYLGTVGNQAQLGMSDMAMGLLEDARVSALGMHIEGFDSLAGLERMAHRARELGKPVVALKVGKSEAARKATVSHTASLAGNDACSEALLKRFGIARVHTLPEFLETLKLFHVHGPLRGFDVASMSCSGGEASIMADAAERRHVQFRPLTEPQRQAVKATLSDLVTVANPLDYHTFIWADRQRMTATFSAMMEARFDLSMVVLDYPRADRCDGAEWEITTEAVIAAARATGSAAAIVSSLSETMPEAVAERLVADGVAPLCGIDEALAAADAAALVGHAWRRPFPEPLLTARSAPGDIVTLYEDAAKRALVGFGLAVPESRLAATPDEAAAMAEAIGFPVALKGLGLAHKTEAGAVALHLADGAAVREAARGILSVAERLLVEKMAPAPVAELIVGAVRDPVAGMVLTVGAGGVLVEVLRDSALLTLPASEADIRAALTSLRVFKLIEGYRGGLRGDVDAAVAAIRAIAGYVAANAERLEEVDVNPLLVLPEGQGVVAVDALIRIRKDET